jgi:energy-coupling factor transport system ATP-binding protein
MENGSITAQGVPGEVLKDDHIRGMVLPDFSTVTRNRPVVPDTEPIISVDNLTHRYGNVQALSGISLVIRKGEFVAIVGENGSGKTTLVKHFNCLLSPTSGEVIVNGKNTKGCSIATLARDVGLVFQNPDHMFFADTVREEVAYGVKNLGIENADAVIDAALHDAGLSGSADLYPRWLSRGERQRLGIACVVAMQPRVIVLDEPTTGLDGYEALLVITILKQLQEKGHTIIIITHNRDIADHCADRIITMENGKIISDTGSA